jgi:cytochrome b6-f complex iron-sulfur subunit
VTISKAEFIAVKKEKSIQRAFVLLDLDDTEFPICLYKQKEESYTACLLKCTHRSCELNVGGGIYSCPCHGSEFSNSGRVLEGPAIKDLTSFKTETDYENIYIYF